MQRGDALAAMPTKKRAIKKCEAGRATRTLHCARGHKLTAFLELERAICLHLLE